MIASPPFEQPAHLADPAPQPTDHTKKSIQHVASDGSEFEAGKVQDMRHQASALFKRASEQANVLAQRSAQAVRDRSQELRDKVLHTSDSTVNYIQHKPVKAMLIAAATGAALMALVSLMSRGRDRG